MLEQERYKMEFSLVPKITIIGRYQFTYILSLKLVWVEKTNTTSTKKKIFLLSGSREKYSSKNRQVKKPENKEYFRVKNEAILIFFIKNEI